MIPFAVDASAVAKLIFPEPFREQAFALFAEAQDSGTPIIAPYLLPVELTNIVRKRMRSEQLTLAQGTARLQAVLTLPIDLREPPGLHERALALTEAYSLGGHDAHYVALAQMVGCDLWVADGRLLRAVGGRLPFVKWLGDYQLPDLSRSIPDGDR